MEARHAPESHLPLKPLTYTVLLALARCDDYGYGIAKRIAAREAGAIRIAPSNLYHVLDRLLERRLIREASPDDPGDERRTYYGLTPLGRRVLAAETRRLRRMLETADSLHVTAGG